MQWLPLMFQKLLFCIINFIAESSNYIIIWFHVSVSLFYIVVRFDFAWEWICLSVLQHSLGINDNPVIKMYCKYHHPDIIGDIVYLLRLHCHFLDVPGLSSEEQHDRQIHCWVRMFSCLFPSLRINIHVISILHFIYLCCISVILSIFPYIYAFSEFSIFLVVLLMTPLPPPLWQQNCSLFCIGVI